MKWTLAMALSLTSVAMWAADTGKPMKLMGYISDSKCAAMHNSKEPDASCVKKCISMGAKPVFIDDEKKAVWAIDNPDTISNDYGKKVAVTASVDESGKSIHIVKVDSAQDVKGSSGMMDDKH